MATTEHFYTGNGSTTTFAFTFPYLANTDVEVELDNVLKTENSSGQTNNDYTISNTNIVFNSAPGNGVAIHIYRLTNVDTAQATFAAGSSIRAADLNNNQTQALYSAQESAGQLIRQSDLKDSIVTSAKIVDGTIATGDLADSLITTAKINADAVTGAKIADDQINSEHYVSGSIDTEHIADSNVTTAKIADSNVTTAKIADLNVTTAKLAAGSVTADKIAGNSITASQLANSAVEVNELANNAVATAKIADSAVIASKIADSNVTTTKIADLNVTTVKLAADAVNGTKIADNSINSEHYVDGSIDTAHIADSQVTTAKIADLNVTTAKLAADAVTNAKIADDQIDSEHYVAGSIDTEHIANSQITTDKIAADAVTNAKIADDSIDSEHYVDGSIDTAHIAGAQVTDAKLASNSVTTSKITDANVTTVKVADANITLAKLASDLKQTTISDSDTQLPTSGAVVDYVAAQIAPIGGLEVIANEDSFPTSQPISGVVISIADIEGLIVSGSGVATNARTSGNGSDNVTINGFPSSLQSKTMAAGLGLMVSSTGSSQTYTYHKLLAKEADVEQLSNDINDFAARYRVHAGEPGSNNDAGDLVYDTNANKMKVYDGSTSSWKEVTSTGDFKYLFLCPAGGSGAPTINGSIATYDLRESSNSGSAAAVTSAAQLIVSVNGVIQKANTGTSAPSEGFALVDGNTIIFGSNLQTGDSVFVVQIGSAVTIPTPGDGTVIEAKIASGAVTTAKIADDAVTGAKIADNLDIPDNNKIRFGTGNDLQIYHDGSHSRIDDVGTGSLMIQTNGTDVQMKKGTSEIMAKFIPDAAVELFYDNIKRFETASNGVNIVGGIFLADNGVVTCGSSNDFLIYHDGTDNIYQSAGAINHVFKPKDTDVGLKIIADGGVELYYDNGKKLETTSTGATVTGNLGINVASPDSPLEVGGTGPSLATIHHTDGGTNDEARLMLGALSSNPPDQRGAGISAKNKGAGHDLEIQTSSTHSAGPTTKMIVTAGGHTIPAADSSHNLGLNTIRWLNVYADTYYGDGSNLTGISSVGGSTGVDFNDNVKARFGTGNDLEIYHNGTDSHLDNGTGELALRSDTIRLRGKTGNETLAVFEENGAAKLYYDNSKKFETESTGINVISSTPRINFDANSVAEAGRIQLSESSGGGVMLFNTKTTSGSLTESFRINTDQSVSIATSQVMNSAKLNIAKDGTHITCKSHATGGYDSIFFRSANTNVGKIHFNSGGTQYHTSSDYRRKENIVNLTGAIDRVKLLQPKRFNFKTDSSTTLDGFLAHEVTPAVPQAILGEKDAVETTYYEEGDTIPDGKAIGDVKDTASPVYQTIDHSTLVPLLTGALKEAITKIETLETKVAALEAA